ncbi:MAG: hypothetical protein LBI55_02205 [Oscillospiraceae bacterium]|jgi:hypothetical protein|nr:hypothetical protein [Oscillospiraceae bacterium]
MQNLTRKTIKGAGIFYRCYYTGDDEELIDSAIKIFSSENSRMFVCTEEEDFNSNLGEALKDNNLVFIVGDEDFVEYAKRLIVDFVDANYCPKKGEFKGCKGRVKACRFFLFIFGNRTIILLPEQPRILSEILKKFIIPFIIKEYIVKRRFKGRYNFKIKMRK